MEIIGKSKNSNIDIINPTFHISTMLFILKIEAIARIIPISCEIDIFHNYLGFFCGLPVSGCNLSEWIEEMRKNVKSLFFDVQSELLFDYGGATFFLKA